MPTTLSTHQTTSSHLQKSILILFFSFASCLTPFRIDWNAAHDLTPKLIPNASISSPLPQPLSDPPQPTKSAAPVATTTAVPADPEIEKRKERAARFGIPFVEPSKDSQPSPKVANSARAFPTKSAIQVNVCISIPSPVLLLIALQEPEKVMARAARFGIEAPTTAPVPAPNKGQKRAAPTEQVDPEEQERRRKRAERFGLAKHVRPSSCHRLPPFSYLLGLNCLTASTIPSCTFM